MSNQLSIEILEKKRQELLLEKEAFLGKINVQINAIEASIEQLSGKRVWSDEPPLVYDDNNPDYIKSSIEEI